MSAARSGAPLPHWGRRRLDSRPAARPTARRRLHDAGAASACSSVKHIVVLMMENRSFDQMLGFLEQGRHARSRRARASAKTNLDRDGQRVPEPFEWGPARPLHAAARPQAEDPRPLPLARSCVARTARRTTTPASSRTSPTTRKDERRQRDRARPGVPESADGSLRRPATCRSTTTSRATSASATTGTPRSPATPGPTASTRWPAAQGRSIGHKPGRWATCCKEIKGLPLRRAGCEARRSSRSRPSPGSCTTRSGAGTRTTRRRCARPTATTATSATSSATTSPTSTARR